MKKQIDWVQTIWGTALLLMGVGVLFRIPQIMPMVEKMEQFSMVMPFIRFSFYLIGFLLIAGGGRKLYLQYYAIVNMAQQDHENG